MNKLRSIAIAKSYISGKQSLVVGILVFSVSCVNVGSYGYLDDYSNVWDFKHNIMAGLQMSFGQGRPLLGLVVLLIFFPIQSINQLIFIHLLSSLCLGLLGFTIHKILSYANENSRNFSDFTIFWMSAAPLLGTTGFMIFGAWCSEFPALLCMTLGSYGVLLILKKPTSPKGYVIIGINLLAYQPNFILLVLLFITSQIIYISNSQNEGAKLIRFLNRSSVTVISICFLVELTCLEIGKKLNFITGARSHFTSNYYEKYQWFIHSEIPRILNFLVPWQPVGFVVLMSVVLLSVFGIIIFCWKSTSIKKSLLLITFGLLFSVSPNLLSAENWASSRSILAPQWFIMMLVSVPILKTLGRIAKLPIGTFTLSIIIVTLLSLNYYNINYLNFRAPQERELKIVRAFLTVSRCEQVKFVTQSAWTDTLSPRFSFDEYGIPSTTPPWVPVPLTKEICLEKGVKVKSLLLSSTVSQLGTSEVVDYHQLLIRAKKK